MRRRLLKQGGARLDRARVSHNLKRRQCSDLIQAAYAAWQIGQPLNRFITILWERGGIDPRNNAAATGKFIKLAKDWARRHGYNMCWAWVQEHGEVNGAHVHILLHVPSELAHQFSPMPLRWVKQILPGSYQAKVLKSLSVGSKYSPENNPRYYEAMLMTKVHYMLKAAPPDIGQNLALYRYGQYSTVFGKRLAIWQGWKYGMERADLAV